MIENQKFSSITKILSDFFQFPSELAIIADLGDWPRAEAMLEQKHFIQKRAYFTGESWK